jgi:hypothetical protein
MKNMQIELSELLGDLTVDESLEVDGGYYWYGNWWYGGSWCGGPGIGVPYYGINISQPKPPISTPCPPAPGRPGGVVAVPYYGINICG